MTNLESFARSAAKRYLHNVVFVDDEIYAAATGQPIDVTAHIPLFVSPFAGTSAQTPIPSPERQQEQRIPCRSKQLVESFAREGMVCALYEPSEGFDSTPESELFKLCERADVVILDWDLFEQDGRNILPLIANLVDQSQSSVPHHARLCTIYTSKPDLARVGAALYDYLKKANLTVEDAQSPTTLIAGATRIIVLGKPNVSGRSDDAKALEVREVDLADRVINEFAKMHNGILASCALHGMASIRRNSKKILDKFHSDMDGPFLLHRALLISHEDAFEQLPELIAEELLAVMLDDQVPSQCIPPISQDCASTFSLQSLDWKPPLDGRPTYKPGELARMYLCGGLPAIEKDYKFPKKGVPIAALHEAMGCAQSKADKRLAALFSLRTRYTSSKPPTLGFGTIVRWQIETGQELQYALCLMPICDGIRLEYGGGRTTSFPFWTLSTSGNGANARGFVVATLENTYVDLFASGKPRDMLWIESFAPSVSGTVVAIKRNTTFEFHGSQKKLEWVAQLKPTHAQRVAHDIGQSFSRIGVVEAEWIRLVTESQKH